MTHEKLGSYEELSIKKDSDAMWEQWNKSVAHAVRVFQQRAADHADIVVPQPKVFKFYGHTKISRVPLSSKLMLTSPLCDNYPLGWQFSNRCAEYKFSMPP